MKFRLLVGSILMMSVLAVGFVALQQPASAGGCYMPRVKMGGTAVTVQAIRMRSMPCMEEGEVVVTARGGETMTILEFSDNWYKLRRADGTVAWIYAKGWLKDINAYEVHEDAHDNDDAPKITPVRKPVLSLLKFKRALVSIKKNYSTEKIDSLVAHFAAIKTEAPELGLFIDYVIVALQK